MKISDLDQPRIGDIVEFETDPDTVVEGVIVGETEDGYIYEFSDTGYTELVETCTYGKYYCSTDKKYKCRQGLNEFSFDKDDRDEDPGEDPYKYPKPELYRRSVDFFGKFEADHFDREDFDDATGVFKGYWGNTQIAYFKFANPAKTGSDDPGMGWYYEPELDNDDDNTSTKPAAFDNSEQRKQQELGMIDAFLKSGQQAKPGSQIYSLMKRHGMTEAHPNSKIYDKCWDGYKKVPGKKRGEKGSCVEESSGYIPRNSKEAQDPRWSNALTDDVTTHTMRDQLADFFPSAAPNDGQQQIREAEYQGREVPLGRPMRGDVKKFKVYVRDPKSGNVKKINFGHGGSSARRLGQKTMRIKKSNPARRRNFRARHRCNTAKNRMTARYWSCRAW